MGKKMYNDLTSGSVAKKLLAFAVPLLLSSILQTVYNMVDMIIVGRFVGKIGLSAVSVGGDILIVLTSIGMGLTNAGQVIISQYLGAKQRDNVRKLIGTMFTILIIGALVISGVFLLLCDPIMHLVNTPEEAYADAKAYIITCAIGLVFIYGYNLVSAILRGMGNSRHPFIFIAIASILNIILDLLFVAVFDMGAFGAALATVIAQAFSFIAALVFLYKRQEEFGFDFKFESFKIDREVLNAFLKLGIPMMLQLVAVDTSKMYVNACVNAYGVVASAVSGIGGKLSLFPNMIVFSLFTAGGTMIGQCIGAEKYSRVPKAMSITFITSMVFSTLFTVATIFAPNVVFGMFTTDTEVLAMCLTYIPIAVLQYMGGAFRAPMSALINGSGNSRLALIVGLLDAVVTRVGLAFLLGHVFKMGPMGYWYGSSIASFMPFFVGGIYFISGKWKTRKYIIKD